VARAGAVFKRGISFVERTLLQSSSPRLWGQPSATHSMRSERRHRTARPILKEGGIRPSAAQRRTVRVVQPRAFATCLTFSSWIDPVLSPSLACPFATTQSRLSICPFPFSPPLSFLILSTTAPALHHRRHARRDALFSPSARLDARWRRRGQGPPWRAVGLIGPGRAARSRLTNTLVSREWLLPLTAS